MIQDKKSGQFLSVQESVDFLIENVSLVSSHLRPQNILIGFDDYVFEKYNFVIFAQKMNDCGILSKEAKEDLIKLVGSWVPFDVGFNNIFSDKEGNAVIIDTEYKGESSTDSVKKLKDNYLFDLEEVAGE